MSDQETGRWIPDGDQVAAGPRLAVHAGGVGAVQRLLGSHPALATARLGSKVTGTAAPLHLVADWPGYFPNGPQIARLLVARGARVDKAWPSRSTGGRPGIGDHHADQNRAR